MGSRWRRRSRLSMTCRDLTNRCRWPLPGAALDLGCEIGCRRLGPERGDQAWWLAVTRAWSGNDPARLRLRGVLWEVFAAALEAFADLDAGDVLELLAYAPNPDRCARLSTARITGALPRANRRTPLPART